MSAPPDRPSHHTYGPLVARTPVPRCRRCGYSLAGLRWSSAHLTCPECGLAGTPDEVILEAQAAPMSWAFRILLIAAPMTACFGIIFLLAVLKVGAGLAIVLAIIGGCAGLFMPVTMASYSMDREPHGTRRPFVFLLTLIGGWLMNTLIALWMMLTLSRVF